jgi:hypothetical protein
MRLHILSRFSIEAFEQSQEEFLADDIVQAIVDAQSFAVTSDCVAADLCRQNPKLKHYQLDVTRCRVSAKFISEYLADCARKNLEGQEAICDAIKHDIADIDQRISELEQLEQRRKELCSVLEHMGDSSFLQIHGEEAYQAADLDDNSEPAKETRQRIVALLREHGPLSNNELMTQIGHHLSRIIIRQVKWLGERDIVSRDRTTADNKIIPGPKFNEADLI